MLNFCDSFKFPENLSIKCPLILPETGVDSLLSFQEFLAAFPLHIDLCTASVFLFHH